MTILYKVDLPPFLRFAWVNEQAQAAWASRLVDIVRSYRRSECASVFTGIRDSALVSLNSHEAGELIESAKQYGCEVDIVQRCSESRRSGLLVALTRAGRMVMLQDAIAKKDDAAIGRLLGYPECCIDAYVRLASHQLDHPIPSVVSAEIQTADVGSHQCSEEIVQTIAERSCYVENNTLWKPIGVTILPYEPCSADCRRSISFGQTFLSLLSEPIASWLIEMLSWPVEWSSLHGLGELRTPILKVGFPTIGTLRKVAIRWIGSKYPNEGARGARFPFRSIYGLSQLVTVSVNK